MPLARQKWGFTTFGRVTVCAACAALWACASTPEPRIGLASSFPQAELGQSPFAATRPAQSLLQPSDAISVLVYREPDLSLDSVQIGGAGTVSLPLLGTITAAGFTPVQLEAVVATRLANAGVREPQVSINLVQQAIQHVTIDGAVTRPGVYQFHPGARLSAAVAMGGGLTRTARREQLAVFRETGAGVMVAKFDYGQINQGIMLDPVLEAGDRVFVGTSGMSVFWQDFLASLPSFGVFATVGVDALSDN